MNEKTLLDRLHARAQGRLTPDERARLERELASDPTLAALAQDYALVHALTAGDPAAGGASRTTFDELAPRLAPRSPARRAAAAAALLLVGGALGYGARLLARPGDEPLRLAAIELGPPAGAAPLAGALDPALPVQWANYDPRGQGGVSFLTDLEQARELSRALRRPLLMYGFYPGCPMAAALDAKVFTDGDVIELAERTVPVRVDMSQVSDDEERAMLKRGYPYLEMYSVEGEPTFSLARKPEASNFLESLHDGLAESDATGEQPEWEVLHAFARRFLDAHGSEGDGRMADAERGYRELLDDGSVPPELARHARVALRRLSDEARDLLFEAARATDAAAARATLLRALERFRGTRYEVDLRGALERVERDGRFPPLSLRGAV